MQYLLRCILNIRKLRDYRLKGEKQIYNANSKHKNADVTTLKTDKEDKNEEFC